MKYLPFGLVVIGIMVLFSGLNGSTVYVSYEKECNAVHGDYSKEFDQRGHVTYITGVCKVGHAVFEGKAITQVGVGK